MATPLTRVRPSGGRTAAVWALLIVSVLALALAGLLALGLYVGDGMRCDHPTLTCDYTESAGMGAVLAVTGIGGFAMALAGVLTRRRPMSVWLGAAGVAAQCLSLFVIVGVVFRVFG
ncbi:hypothetical protein Afil01_17420 [Actinorhabdospora filicis]|uniref:Uncharacterized protein n=1 Tax=Actinorhabdospora filicis TaxID=1785913 RepID=A0A9W6SJ72_9ACTN|nr:hypothetical protein [Actinorhabdospora filicis]GLZ76935.1 hypothetical protein Afil01_17420 [Actinorhabdospora filicis]